MFKEHQLPRATAASIKSLTQLDGKEINNSSISWTVENGASC